MDERKFAFLIAVLGVDGARALRKAVERSSECETVLVPRAILAWLALPQEEYEGDLPGIENTYCSFKKSENGFDGSVTMGKDVYQFQGASQLHLASAIAVSIGVDSDRPHPSLRDLDLVRLGKSIDLLAKARYVAERLAKSRSLEKAISLIPPGPEVREPKAATAKVYDYSHVLPERRRKDGYRLQVRHRPESGTVTAHIFKGPLEVGQLKGSHENGALSIEDAEVQEAHQNKGLGTALYESLMAHAKHSGINKIAGGVHSSMASAVHQKLSRKHGMEYKQTPTPFPHLASPEPGPYDGRYGPYEYAIKEEVPANAKKTEAPAPAHAPTAPQEPQAPMAPTVQAQKGPAVSTAKPKLPKTLKVTKSQSRRKCSICGLPQFRGDTFRGCLCLSDLAKHASSTPNGDGYLITFRAEWDKDALETLLEAINGTK